MSAKPSLHADADQIAAFYKAIFKHATPGSWIHFRAFEDGAKKTPFRFYRMRFSAAAEPNIIAKAVKLAGDCALKATPIGFCPPPATFRVPEKPDEVPKANEASLADGLVLAVELDKNPSAARARLRPLLGEPTIVVASGGEWCNPETGELEPKLHIYWRLATPARSEEDQKALKHARNMACEIAGGDRTAISIVHPMRWPGGWHRKDPAHPRLTKIIAQSEAEIDLRAAIAALATATGMVAPTDRMPKSPSELRAPSPEALGYAAFIPNDGAEPDWNLWNRVGMALYGASGGTAAGLALYEAWSAKSDGKYEKTELPAERWAHYHKYPPTKTGWDTIVTMADCEAAMAEIDKASAEAVAELDAGAGQPAAPVAPAVDGHAATEATPAPLPPSPPPPLPQPPPQPSATGAAVRATAQQPAAQGWPELIDITAGDIAVPPFPVRLLPPPFSTFVADVADRMQVPPDFVAIPLLVETATMLGREFTLKVKRHDDWTERACLWGNIIAPSGTMKSPAVREALRPIGKMQGELQKKYKTEYAAWKAKKDDKNSKEDPGPPPKPEVLLVHEATVEALAARMSEEYNANPRGMLLHRDELAGWYNGMNKYRGGKGDDRQFYLQCYNGGNFRSDRKDGARAVSVEDAYLNILGTIQPGIISTIFRGKEGDEGLTARFQLAVWPQLPDQIDYVDRRPDYDAIKAVEDRLGQIRKLSPMDGKIGGGGVLRFSGPAQVIFDDWCLRFLNRPERHKEEMFAVHLSKYPGTFARLALVLHFMKYGGEASGEIDAETAKAARDLIEDYLKPHARRIYGVLDAHPAMPGAKQIANWIRSGKSGDRFTLRDVRQKDWRVFKVQDDERAITAALNLLEANGWVRGQEKHTTVRGGRPTIMWAINPAAPRGTGKHQPA
jgi:putative DNA primase/helicase